MTTATAPTSDGRAERSPSGTCDVAILGAGPYGLAAATQLRSKAPELDIVAFGEPMSFWERQMPRGMLLRSPYVASDIGDPDGPYSLPAYERDVGLERAVPVPLDRFVDYGRWIQRQVLPDLRTDRIEGIARDGERFELTVSGGEVVQATRVVIAGGIHSFAFRPPLFAELGPRATHACDHDDLGVFSGRRVLVVGAGQSALESAALLTEAGADVEIAARASDVRWLSRRWHHKLGAVSALLYAPAEVGPAGVSRFVSAPGLFRRLPRSVQDWMTVKSLRPAGAGWLPSRLAHVPIRLAADPVRVDGSGEQVVVGFGDGSAVRVDHVLLGTGYRVDIRTYPFLAPRLAAEIRVAGGYPVLRRGFESSVDGLYFLGAPAAWTFGPLMRFVAGTAFASSALATSIAARSA
jgi:FAD-dependent urate hydroxylase